jgi:hypothetical protein
MMARLKRYWGLRPWKRHSLILAVAGFLYALVGLTYALYKPTPGRKQSLSFLLDVAPAQFWGGLFICSGALTMISSIWPPFAETWGYMILTGLSAGWSAVYLMGVLFFGSQLTNITQVILWGTLAFMWWAISGLLNPDRSAVIENVGD